MSDPVPYGQEPSTPPPAAPAAAPRRGALVQGFYIYRMIRYGVLAAIGLVVATVGPIAGGPWTLILLGLLLVALAGFGIWRTQARWSQSAPQTMAQPMAQTMAPPAYQPPPPSTNQPPPPTGP